MVDPRKIAILGAGRIGESLISGLLSSGWREPEEVAATARRAERVAELRERFGIEATLSNHDAAAGAALIVIAVKPQDIEGLLGEIGTLVHSEQTVLSVAAAIPTSRIEQPAGRWSAGRARNAEHAVDRARGDRGTVRGLARRRRAPGPRRGGALAPRRRRARAGGLDGRDHRGLGLGGPRTSRCSPRR